MEFEKILGRVLGELGVRSELGWECEIVRNGKSGGCAVIDGQEWGKSWVFRLCIADKKSNPISASKLEAM